MLSVWFNFEIIWISWLQFTEGEERGDSCGDFMPELPSPITQPASPSLASSLTSFFDHISQGEGGDLFLRKYILWFITKSEIRPMSFTIHYNPSLFPHIFCWPFSHRSFHAPVWQSDNTCGALQIISWTTWICLNVILLCFDMFKYFFDMLIHAFMFLLFVV